MNNSEGALERVLGRLRQRNFMLCSLAAGRSSDHSLLDARIVVESARPIEMAVKQLGKLYEVQDVMVKTMEGTVTHVYSQNSNESQLKLCASL